MLPFRRSFALAVVLVLLGGCAWSRAVAPTVPPALDVIFVATDLQVVRAMLDMIRARVVAVVEIPRNERATLAIVKGQPITEADAGLRGAYVELAMTVARALN